MLLVADTHRIGSMPACQPGSGQVRHLLPYLKDSPTIRVPKSTKH